MNIKHTSFLLITVLFSVFLISCNKDNNSVEYTGQTNDAQIYSFSLIAPFLKQGDSISRAQDSIRILKVNKTNYSIDQLSNIVYNQDSLPYLTSLKNVKVSVSFNPAYGVAQVQVVNRDSTYVWNTTDSIDFSKAPIEMIVTSWGSEKKRYRIDVRTHKIDPDLIVWNKMPSLTAVGNSKSFLYNDALYSYISTNNSVVLNKTSKNNISWNQISLSGLTSTMNIESFTVANKIFNAIDKSGLSYTSVNGQNWTKLNNGYNVVAIVGVIPTLAPSSSSSDDLLVIINRGNKLYFAKGTSLNHLSEVQNIEGLVGNNVPANFPTSSISSFSNDVKNKSDRMLVVAGGYSDKGSVITDRWLIRNVSGGIQITPFIQKPVFTTNPGLSIFPYNNMFYILNAKKTYTSDNKGERWVLASEKQFIDSKMNTYSNQSVIVDDNNYIWVLGGMDSNKKYLNEVWRGRLNSLIP